MRTLPLSAECFSLRCRRGIQIVEGRVYFRGGLLPAEGLEVRGYHTGALLPADLPAEGLEGPVSSVAGCFSPGGDRDVAVYYVRHFFSPRDQGGIRG